MINNVFVTLTIHMQKQIIKTCKKELTGCVDKGSCDIV